MGDESSAGKVKNQRETLTAVAGEASSVQPRLIPNVCSSHWRNFRVRLFFRFVLRPEWAGSEKPAVLNPGAIAGLYRALRKGREDAKDEPGAADFYYGEMEMRRHAHGQPDGSDGARGRVDRGVLTAYWLVSGYGLRAWRALAWLAGITVAFAVAFHLVGFIRPPQPASYWTSLLYAFRSTISLTDDKVTLSAWGQLLQA